MIISYLYKDLPKKYRQQIQLYWEGKKKTSMTPVHEKAAIHLLVLEEKVQAYAVVTRGVSGFFIEEMNLMNKTKAKGFEAQLEKNLLKLGLPVMQALHERVLA
jgi:hypothetical protein